MSLSAEQLQEAIDNCDSDPIHIPGSIQDFGLLIGADLKFEQISWISENFAGLTGSSAETYLNQPTEAIFTRDEQHAIRNALQHSTISTQREILTSKQIGGKSFQLSVHRRGKTSIVEMIPEIDGRSDQFSAIEQSRPFFTALIDSADLTSFFDSATARIRAITGFDRVKFYKFLPDGAGEVIAEARHPEMPSFLGLRFPATDIPPIARKLYAETPIRTIASVKGADAALLGVEGEDPLDLSLAVLRGKDAVHQQYLINMEVGATLTIPVVVLGELWGLFAAHHRTDRVVPPAVLSTCELAGKLISLRLQHALTSRRSQIETDCLRLAGRLVIADDSALSATSYWDAIREEVAELLPCDGVLLEVDGNLSQSGNAPSADVCAAIFALGAKAEETMAFAHDLPQRQPDVDWGKIAGALVIRTEGTPSLQIAFLRNSNASTVNWAGAPEKDVSFDDEKPKLHPRHSFEAYQVLSRDKAIEWSSGDVEVASSFRDALISSSATQAILFENRHRMGLMVRELNHRVRNILSLVQSLSQHSRQESRSIEAYADVLESRIAALAGAHNLLTRSDMQGALLDELITLELKPYDGQSNRVTVAGPKTVLRPDAASILALLVHELTTNAVKYGGLSVPEGRVSVSWSIVESSVKLTWEESGGPAVVPPEHSGFGRSIIGGIIDYELQGKSDIAFDPSGVRAQFVIPGNVIVDAVLPPTVEPRKPLAAPPAVVPASLGRALVVEDNFVVAMQACHLLEKCGFGEVDAVATLHEAFSALANKDYAFVLLDVNLQGQISSPVARHLSDAGIPFIFASGYGSDSHDIARNFDAPYLTKPVDEREVRDLLSTLFQEDDK